MNGIEKITARIMAEANEAAAAVIAEAEKTAAEHAVLPCLEH